MKIFIDLNNIIDNNNKMSIEVIIKFNDMSRINYFVDTNIIDATDIKDMLKKHAYDYIKSSLFNYDEIICNY